VRKLFAFWVNFCISRWWLNSTLNTFSSAYSNSSRLSYVLSLPHTRATCWANRLAWQLAQQVCFVCVRIWPLEALRKISIVFDVFHLARKKSQRLRMLWAISAELLESISQWETIVSSCDLEQNGGKCKLFCQLCRCWVVFPTCAVKIHSWASCHSRRLAQQVALVCGRLEAWFPYGRNGSRKNRVTIFSQRPVYNSLNM
jgi:hypothetical protein